MYYFRRQIRYIKIHLSVPSAPPRNVACAGVDSGSLEVSWLPPSPSHVHGLLQGYVVFYAPLREWEGELFLFFYTKAIRCTQVPCMYVCLKLISSGTDGPIWLNFLHRFCLGQRNVLGKKMDFGIKFFQETRKTYFTNFNFVFFCSQF